MTNQIKQFELTKSDSHTARYFGTGRGAMVSDTGSIDKVLALLWTAVALAGLYAIAEWLF